MLKYLHYDTEYEIKLQLTQYADGQLALTSTCYDKEYDFWEPFGTFTVNLNYNDNDPAPEDCAYLDTNNMPNVEDWIKENGLGEPTGLTKQSGYCTYPLYRLDIAKIKSIIAQQDKE